jgi:general secretion pathway protein G
MERSTRIGRLGRSGAASGFTLLELMVVISIISILVAIALPNYRVAIIQAREAVLKEDLFRMRDLIDQYHADKGKYPASLSALTEDGYLRKVPTDPMTGGSDWEPVPAQPDPNSPEEQPGVYDVHSLSQTVSLSGTPYNEW